MSDYMRSINKTSNTTSNKDIKILNSILRYYYYFNGLGEVVNTRMMMKMENKKLNLLGNFKLSYDNNKIIFSSPDRKIIIMGSFKCVNDCISYNRHCDVRISVE